jgi:hypothetical protein
MGASKETIRISIRLLKPQTTVLQCLHPYDSVAGHNICKWYLQSMRIFKN